MLDEGLGLSDSDTKKLQKELTHIIHCAASIRFDLPIAEAAEINITGALRILEFAKGCRNLSRLVDVSTAYVTPHPGGDTVLVVKEALADLPFDATEVYQEII